ncbi:hypothetical protein [Streptomyces sp. NPDC059398]|uniref:hypothetical protein n=1 Tax=Streptomyces sp. NPDC059398 TaxID=3346820 RepID=UPI0036924990
MTVRAETPAGSGRHQVGWGLGGVGLMVLAGVAAGAVAALGWPIGAKVAVWVALLALVVASVSLWVRKAQRRLADRVGIEPKRLRALMREIRKERIPADETDREAMRRLVGEQRRQLDRQRKLRRWLGPLLIMVYGGNMVIQIVTHGSVWSVLRWLVIGLLVTTSQYWGPRRTERRLERVAARLDPGAGGLV